MKIKGKIIDLQEALLEAGETDLTIMEDIINEQIAAGVIAYVLANKNLVFSSDLIEHIFEKFHHINKVRPINGGTIIDMVKSEINSIFEKYIENAGVGVDIGFPNISIYSNEKVKSAKKELVTAIYSFLY